MHSAAFQSGLHDVTGVVQARVDGALRAVEDARDVLTWEVQVVTQHQRGPAQLQLNDLYLQGPKVEIDQVKNTFDPKEQTAVLQKVHEKYVDDALFLMVTHDVNARAISPKVKGFVQAKNWFQDFSPITMDK